MQYKTFYYFKFSTGIEMKAMNLFLCHGPVSRAAVSLQVKNILYIIYNEYFLKKCKKLDRKIINQELHDPLELRTPC